MNRIITIGREFGSGGREVGRSKHRHNNAIDKVLIVDLDEMLVDPGVGVRDIRSQIYIQLNGLLPVNNVLCACTEFDRAKL